MTVNDRIRDFVAGLLPASLFSCDTISVPEYAVDLGGGGELRIVHVSDFHSNCYGGKDGPLVRRIREARPDLLVMTGDIFDKDMGPDRVFQNVRDLMEGIAGICPIYYVLGNHEFYTDEKPFLSAIESYGANVLNDEAVLVSVSGRPLVIAGLVDPMLDLSEIEREEKKADHKAAFRARLAALAQKAASLRAESQPASSLKAEAGGESGPGTAGGACASILLSHRPEYIEDYAEWGFDLVFSGHAHGGQWIVPGLVNGLYAVGQGFFPRYAGGLYELDRGGHRMRCIVSRGLSYQKPAFPRFGNPPELPLVTLRV